MSAADGERLLDILLPNGGCVVAFAEVYVDESGTDDKSPVLVIAGYIFIRSKVRKFERQWWRELRTKKLPHFHMQECNRADGIYDGWSDDECLAHEKRLISLTRELSAQGFSYAVREEDYQRLIVPLRQAPVSSYTFLLHAAVAHAMAWKRETKFQGDIVFVFESGAAHEAEALRYLKEERALGRVGKAPPWEFDFAFVSKSKAAALHPADLLAWLSRNAIANHFEDNPIRRDLEALIRPQDELRYYDTVMLEAFCKAYRGDPFALPATKGHIHHFKTRGS